MSDLISRKALLEELEAQDYYGGFLVRLITNAPAIAQGELVRKAVKDALEKAARICDELEDKCNKFDIPGCGDAIRALIEE